MRITQNIFKNLPRKGYLDIFPQLRQKRTQDFTALAFTLIALSFFGFFAINPTLSTIAQLKKQLSDSQLVDKKLGEKIIHLSSLREKYNLLENDIPLILTALPQNPNAPLLIGKIQSLAKESNLTVKKIQSLQLEITKPKEDPGNYSSFIFSFEGEGSSYDDLSGFLSFLINFDRIITIDTLSITEGEGEKLKISLQGKAYFKN